SRAGAGPMQTDPSAMATCFRLRSTVECTATVLMSMAWQARRMRRAISPRLAITTLSSKAMATSANDEQGLIELYRLATLGQDGHDGAGGLRLDLVEHFHRFDDAQRLALGDFLPQADERVGIRAGR